MYLLILDKDIVIDVIKDINPIYQPKENEVLMEKIEKPINPKNDEIYLMKYKNNKIFYEIKRREK